jgi:hypothetical protein
MTTIAEYKYNDVSVLIDTNIGYANASILCTKTFGYKIHNWIKLESTKRLFKTYYWSVLSGNTSGEPSVDSDDKTDIFYKEAIIKKGLHIDKNMSSTDVWIPLDLLPLLAGWFSPLYSIFIGKIMNMFHADPMRLAAMAVKEHDRQTGLKSTVIISSTILEEEHKKNLELIRDLTAKNNSLTQRIGIIERSHLSKLAETEVYTDLVSTYKSLSSKETLESALRDMKTVLDRQRAEYMQHINHLSAKLDSLKKDYNVLLKENADLRIQVSILQDSMQDHGDGGGDEFVGYLE